MVGGLSGQLGAILLGSVGGGPMPTADVTFMVGFDDRVLVVGPETRVFVVGSDTRLLVVGST